MKSLSIDIANKKKFQTNYIELIKKLLKLGCIKKND